MRDAGERDHLVTIQRATTSESESGHGEPTWSTITTGWARLSWGSGQERRDAAQEAASQAITAEFDWTPTLAAVKATDRMLLFDVAWDITSRIITSHNQEVHITAVANLDAAVDS